MQRKDAQASKSGGNPEVRALVKQVADLVSEARSQEALVNSLEARNSETDLESFNREIDQRWQTIEQVAAELFQLRPQGLAEAAGQAAAALALSNAGQWDEDHSLTAAALGLAAAGWVLTEDPPLAEAMNKLMGGLNL